MKLNQKLAIFFILLLIPAVLFYQNCAGVKNNLKSGSSSQSSSMTYRTPIAATNSYMCVSKSTEVICSGGVQDYASPYSYIIPFSAVPTRLLSHSVTQLTASILGMCYLDQGDVYCWGYAVNGENGDGTFQARSAPVKVVGLTEKQIKIGTGFAHSCALSESGKVRCWGYGYIGRLGSGVSASTNVPVDVVGLETGVTDLFVGSHESCVIQNQNLKCWGNDIFTTQALSPPGGSVVYISTPTTPTNFVMTSTTKILLTGPWLFTLDNGVVKKWGVKSDNTRALGEVYTGLESGVSDIYSNSGDSQFCARKSGQVYCQTAGEILQTADANLPATGELIATAGNICFYSGAKLMCKGWDSGQFGTGTPGAPVAGTLQTQINRPTPIATGF